MRAANYSLTEAKPENYFDGMRHEMVPFVPVGIEVSLEVGCGTGSFSSALKASGMIKTAWGLELDLAAGEKAAALLDEVRIGDAEKLVDDLPDDFFDLIIFNDSLEHLINPFLFLEKVRGKLRDGGKIIASIPNVRYYKNLYALVCKRQWRYTDAGILDRTHLRFFTEISIQETFAAAGYDIATLRGINECRKLKVRLWGPLTLGVFRDIRYLQFAVVATVRKSPPWFGGGLTAPE